MSKRNVCFVSQEEPEFIQKLKNKVGYKEEKVDIQDKFAKNDGSEVTDKSKMAKIRRPIDSDDEEYKPQVVVLENSNVTPADVETCKALAAEEEEEPTGGRIMFKRPLKRKLESVDAPADKLAKKLSVEKPKGKTGIKRNLLSFDVEE